MNKEQAFANLNNKIKFKMKNIDLNYFNEKLKKNEPFTYLKILHGFWEKITSCGRNEQHSLECNCSHCSLENTISNIKNNKNYSKTENCQSQYFQEKENEIYDEINNSLIRNDEKSHYLEIIKLIMNTKTNDNLVLGVHYEPWPNAFFSHLWDEQCCINAVKSMNQILENKTVYNGHVFKQACMNGNILNFYKNLKRYHVVLVGLHHLNKVNNYFKFENFTFYPVNSSLASRKEKFLKEFIEFDKKLKTEKTKVYLTQLGGSLNAWFGYKVHETIEKKSFLIDVGRSIDIWGCKKTTPYSIFEDKICKKKYYKLFK